jgi:hypothetical protein
VNVACGNEVRPGPVVHTSRSACEFSPTPVKSLRPALLAAVGCRFSAKRPRSGGGGPAMSVLLVPGEDLAHFPH